MTTRSTGSRLAQLLIISAIDLLLCCFTMAVMLFLVFQPSQRPDRTSAISNVDKAPPQDAGRAGTVSSNGIPALIIVRNTGQNPLAPPTKLPPGYRLLSRPPGNVAVAGPLVFTAASSNDLLPLKLAADPTGTATSASIWITGQDRLKSYNIYCASGETVEVKLSAKQSVVEHCEPRPEGVTMAACPFHLAEDVSVIPGDQVFGFSQADARNLGPGDSALLIQGKGVDKTIVYLDTNENLGSCVVWSPVATNRQQQDAIIKKCIGRSDDKKSYFTNPRHFRCVRDELFFSGGDTKIPKTDWNIRCSSAAEAWRLVNPRIYFLFVYDATTEAGRCTHFSLDDRRE